MAKLGPTQGGCWFCNQDDEQIPLVFDSEWDTFVHLPCLVEALKDPDDGEAACMTYLLTPVWYGSDPSAWPTKTTGPLWGPMPMTVVQGPERRYHVLGPGGPGRVYIIFDWTLRDSLAGDYPTFEAANQHATELNNAQEPR